VLPDARESTNKVKKGVVKELFSEIVVFLAKKGSYTTFKTVKIRRIWKKKGKIRKTWSMTKKRSSEFLGVKTGNSFEKSVFQKSWSAKNFSVPPNSAPGLRHCSPPYTPNTLINRAPYPMKEMQRNKGIRHSHIALGLALYKCSITIIIQWQ